MILEQYNVVHAILTPKNWIPPYQPGPVLPHHLLQSPPICAGCKRHDQSVATAIGIPRHIPLLFGAEAQLHLWSFSYPYVAAANSSVNFPIFGDCGEKILRINGVAFHGVFRVGGYKTNPTGHFIHLFLKIAVEKVTAGSQNFTSKHLHSVASAGINVQKLTSSSIWTWLVVSIHPKHSSH